MLHTKIKSEIDKLWDKFWSGGISNPLSAMEQISYLLFMRRLDEMDLKRLEDAQWQGTTYSSIFAGDFEYSLPDTKGRPTGKKRKRENGDLRWSKFRHLPPDEMLYLVRDYAFPFIKRLGGEESNFTEYMADAVFLIPKANLLAEAVSIIDNIYKEIEREMKEDGLFFSDVQGDLYEHLLSEISTAGKNGQFRTPRHIIQMIVNLVDPKLGEEIIDPAAGTGGFLLGAYQHILYTHTSEEHRQIDEHGIERGIGNKLTDQRQWEVLCQRTLYGYDIDQTMVRIGLMNLLLHGIDQPNIRYADTLSKRYQEANEYDVALANPPFKGSIDQGDINEDLKLGTTKTELLFINRIINLLRIGGRAGVIVPDGVLFGSSTAHRKLREKLIKECDLQGVISMPSGVFKPYAGVSTAVLVFVKGGQTENVWFYDMQADGYSLDDKRNKIDENDIPDLLTRWTSRDPNQDTRRSSKAFFVPKQEIIDNKYDLSINRYKTIEYEEVQYEPFETILDRIEELQEKNRKNIQALRRMLG